MLEKLAKLYATLKGTTVIASSDHGETITFVLESGPKLTKTEDELNTEIAQMQRELNRKPSEPFAYVEEAVKAEQPKGKAKKKGTQSE